MSHFKPKFPNSTSARLYKYYSSRSPTLQKYKNSNLKLCNKPQQQQQKKLSKFMGKRLRRASNVSHRVSPRFSPRSSYLTPHSVVCCQEEDVWTEIAKHLDGKSLVMLGTANKWFNKTVMHDTIWKHLCLRDLNVKDPGRVGFKWNQLYTSAFDGSHAFMFRQKEKHIDWMRIGAIEFDSPLALLTGMLLTPLKVPKDETVDRMLKSCGSILLRNVKTGIWIADLQLVRCPVCDLNTCDGTMQTLDARHTELFLSEGFLDGSWEYELIGTQEIAKNATGACGAIFDIKHLTSHSTAKVFNHKSWFGKADDWQPKAMITRHAVAVNTNLQENNEGLQVKYHIMRAGVDGEIVSIRVSQQLI